jgi:Sulfotransferase family
MTQLIDNKSRYNRGEKKTSQISESGPLFVVGMWRSGTSLLYALLNQHPQVALMYEGDLPLLRPLFRGGKSRTDWLQRWEFWNGALTRHQLSGGRLGSAVSSLPEAMELAYRQYAGDAIWGCKSPNYHDSMTPLAREFPKARFIVICRNPADVARSIARASGKDSWFSRSGMSLRALLGCRELKREIDGLVNDGVPVHVLQYEELVRDPEGALQGICEFLQIPFDAKMLLLENAPRSAIYDREHHDMVKGKQIRASGPREEVLPLELKKKIHRYTNLWREEYRGNWPVYSDPDAAEAGKPGWLERNADSLLYRAYRALDRAVIYAYCVAPLSWLRMYRSMRGQDLGVVTQEERVPVTGD